MEEGGFHERKKRKKGQRKARKKGEGEEEVIRGSSRRSVGTANKKCRVVERGANDIYLPSSLSSL